MIAEKPPALTFRPLFEEQRRRYREKPFPSLEERIATLERLERAIVSRRKDVALALAADLRKSDYESELSEVLVAISALRYARKNLATWMKPQAVRTPPIAWGSRSEVRYEPRGVVLIMAPFNYPFQLAVVPLVDALAAGNRAIVRISEKAPHTRDVVAAILAEAFAPEDVASVGGEIDAAQALLELPFDHIFFTGSTSVGRIVMAAAARHLASVTLELGGKSPALVCEDADLAHAAARIAWGKCFNAGQICIAPDHALVHATQLGPFVAALARSIEMMYGADAAARARTPDFCRLIDDGAFERVAGLIDSSVAAGARIAFGGERNAAERYIAPTILTHVERSMPIMQEEIFGPVLPVLTYDSLAAEIAQFTARPKPLALYIFAKSATTVDDIVKRTSAGSTLVNDVLVQWANFNLPMGGVGASGQGGYHGFTGFRALSHERSIMRQSKLSPVRLFGAPYKQTSRLLLKLLDRIA